jgi:tetratricopeptide (TPR) repeat protein
MTRAVWWLAAASVLISATVAGMYLSGAGQAPSDASQSTEQLAALAKQALAANEFRDCIRLSRGVADQQPLAAEFRLWEGVALWNLDRWQAAEDVWKRSLAIDPQVPETGWRLLRLLQYEHRYIEAEELVLKLYATEPDRGDRIGLLLELIRQDNERVGPEATVKSLEPVLVNEPTNVHALRAIGVSYLQLGRMREGVELLEKSWQLAPDDMEGWFARVWFLLETGQMDELGACWPRLPAAAREQSRFLRYRGMWCEAVHNTEEAERAYRDTLDRDFSDRKAHYQLARLLRASGRISEAESHESQARELDNVRESLANAYVRAKQTDFNISPSAALEFSELCNRLGRTQQAEYWQVEAASIESHLVSP